MEFLNVEIPGLLIVKPDIFQDERGYFFESYNKEAFDRQGFPAVFVQDNESKSKKGVIRGLHFQAPPFEQGKLVRVVRGAIMDVAVDIRIHSPHYGKWQSVILTGENKWMFWIPPGFAHGFLTLEDDTIVVYKCTQVYSRQHEGSLRWNDPELAIQWPFTDLVVSARDSQAPLLNEFKSPFTYNRD